jgi:hypothetical protein
MLNKVNDIIAWNPNHLAEAEVVKSRALKDEKGGYWWHAKLAFKEAGFSLLMSIGWFLHGLLPWLFDFKLLEAQVNRLRMISRILPDLPLFKRVKFLKDHQVK